MKNCEDKSTFTNKLAMMQQYYRQKLLKQKQNHQSSNQLLRGGLQYQEETPIINDFQGDIKGDIQKDELIISQPDFHGFSYFQLKDKITEVVACFDNNQISMATQILEQILLQNKASMQLEQQKQLYVEVLILCNEYLEKYFSQFSHFSLQQLSNNNLKLASNLLSKCDVWTLIYDYEPFMRVLTLINLGVFHYKQRKFSQSIEIFLEVLKIILERKYYTKLAQVYFNLAQLKSIIGEHEKAIDYARKALQQCQSDFVAVNSPDIPKSRMQCDQNLARRNSNDRGINSPRQYQKKQTLSEDLNNESSIQNLNKKGSQQNQIENTENQELTDQESDNNFFEWNKNKLTNLINCFEILAKEEEHFFNFEEANRLFTKAVSISQENLGVESIQSEKQLRKLISFQKRQAEHIRKKQQNMIHQFSHLSIKPLLQNHLNERVIKMDRQINQQLLEKKQTSLGNIFSNRKISPHNILQASPYNQKIIPYQSIQNKVKRARSQQTSQINQGVVIRQKRLNLDTLPCSLKFNVSNGTLPTQNSIVSISTATTKNQYHLERKNSFSNLTNKERKISIQIEEGQQLRNLLLTPNKQQLKGSQTERGLISPNHFQQKEESNNNSFMNEIYSVYPPPRLRSGRELYQTLKQRNPQVESLNSDNFQSIIENTIQKQQIQENAKQKIQSNKRGPILVTSSISSPQNPLSNAKSYHQNFVEQMKIIGDQVNQQCQQINTQFKIQQPSSPLAQIFGDSRRCYITQNGTKKVLIYSDLKGSNINQNQINKYMGGVTDRIEIQTSYFRQNSLNQLEQLKQQNQESLRQINCNQKDQFKQQLQNKLKLEDNNSNNNEHCSTNITTSTHSNSIQTLPTSEKTQEFQRNKAYSIVQKVSFEDNQEKFLLDRRKVDQIELLLIEKNNKIKAIQNQPSQQCQESNQEQCKIYEGITQFLFNKSTMVISIEFYEIIKDQLINQHAEANVQNDLNNLDGQQNSRTVIKHLLNVSDLFSLNLPLSVNKKQILTQLCEKLKDFLFIDSKKQLIISIQSNENLKENQKNVFGFPKIIDFPQQCLSLHLILKDSKSSMIYCKENGKLLNQNIKKMNNSQINRATIPNSPKISNSFIDSSNQVKTSLDGTQLNKQVICSFFTNGSYRDQKGLIDCGESNEKQIKQSFFKQKNQEIQSSTKQQDTGQNLLLQQQEEKQQQQNQQQQTLIINSQAILIYKDQRRNNSENSPQGLINIPINKMPQISKIDSQIKKEIKSDSQSPVIKRTLLENKRDDFKMESERGDTIKSFESSKCIEESAEKRGTSVGSVKFISYYQVPSQIDSSFNSNQNFQFDQSNALRNSSAFKDQKKSNIYSDQAIGKQ